MARVDHTHVLVITADPDSEPEVREVPAPKPFPRHGVLVAYGPNEAELRLLGQLWQATRVEQIRTQALIDLLSPTRILGEAALTQARENAVARAAFLESEEVLTSPEVADLVGSDARNRNAAAHRLLRRGHVFAVRYRGRDLFPAFQFDLAGARPKPVVANVLASLAGAGLQGWEIAFWFTDGNAWLPPKKRPVDLLDSRPELVLTAAAHEADPLPE